MVSLKQMWRGKDTIVTILKGIKDVQGDMERKRTEILKVKNKQNKAKQNQTHGSEGTPNYIDTLYIARIIVTIIQAGTYCTELKLYGFKKLVYVLSDY